MKVTVQEGPTVKERIEGLKSGLDGMLALAADAQAPCLLFSVVVIETVGDGMVQSFVTHPELTNSTPDMQEAAFHDTLVRVAQAIEFELGRIGRTTSPDPGATH